VNCFDAKADVSKRSNETALRGIFRAALLGLFTGFSAGCYTTVPVSSTPQPGQVLVLDLNDQGRAALGPSVGASVTRIEGTLDTRTDSAYTVKVASVVYMNGSNNRWTNEPLTIRSDLVRDMREKKFSRSRSGLLAAGIVGLAAGFIVSRDLLGLGTPDRDKGPDDGSEQ
jgi:hypothetical protein